MFEADALQGVVQFDIDAQIVGVQLQLVPGPDTPILFCIHNQGGDRSIEPELPVLVARRMSLKINELGLLLLIDYERSVHLRNSCS